MHQGTGQERGSDDISGTQLSQVAGLWFWDFTTCTSRWHPVLHFTFWKGCYHAGTMPAFPHLGTKAHLATVRAQLVSKSTNPAPPPPGDSLLAV
jgi:hypothetical protein